MTSIHKGCILITTSHMTSFCKCLEELSVQTQTVSKTIDGHIQAQFSNQPDFVMIFHFFQKIFLGFLPDLKMSPPSLIISIELYRYLMYKAGLAISRNLPILPSLAHSSLRSVKVFGMNLNNQQLNTK